MNARNAIVFGASGGIGAALADALAETHRVHRLSRRGSPPLDLTDEESIAATATAAPEATLMIDCTGFLHDARFEPEKSWRHLSADHMAHAFAVNATGPALLMKHFLPKLPREEPAVFATLSAKVGSIGDNGFGGWYSYRASKAALNQIVKTASIELARKWTRAALVAIHPGTVDTGLSAPFAKRGLDVRPPSEAARDILAVLDGLDHRANGRFLDYKGRQLPW
ncbi:SDR family NAD(P)-dependent oxidoreductase [Marivibrio halodurans]|uniref:SDR family NAD(P)-dependent oxidoreductase n=1 Tax=Marivibrio halodurans TaxID=2039722 RepID=A0A8J7RZK9_9PROT|nr:SDR family NAD(P)-dependent oxidoreductase [Marivibrio halodurans]MBP5855959.1 SDR family NAD(P)-dependent oxidoreductase [Marivibrio halodurans]